MKNSQKGGKLNLNSRRNQKAPRSSARKVAKTKVVAGVDVGSVSVKAVLMNVDEQVLASEVTQKGIVDVVAANFLLNRVLDAAKLNREQLALIVTTGYGRSLASFSNRNITEISCHARGAHFLFPKVRTVIDIGGQDTKVISLDAKGRVLSFVMNDKCAAGTGRFLEVMARALEVEVWDMQVLALESQNPATISSVCTVYAETEVISSVAEGTPKVDIIAGIHESVGRRVAALSKQLIGISPPVLMSGGVAKNKAIVSVLEHILGIEIFVPQAPQIVGALGAALFAVEEVRRKNQTAGCNDAISNHLSR